MTQAAGIATIDEQPRIPAQPPGPLSADHQIELQEANRRARKILNAAKVAGINGSIAALFAGAGLLFGLFDAATFLVALGMAVIAYNEFRGRSLLRQFDPRAGRLLGRNQLGLIGLITAYSGWSIHAGLTGEDPFEAHIRANPGLAPMLGSIGELQQTLTVAVHGTVIALTLIFQGLNARYYFKRTAMIVTHLHQTPAWITDLQRATHE